MNKPLLAIAVIFFLSVQQTHSQEIFAVDSINRTLTPSGSRYYLAHPFEITYGPDDSLYITEKVGRVIQVSALTGHRKIILDHRASTVVNITRNGAGVATSIGQNGMMGMALHKNFKNGSNFIYIAYSNTASTVRISRFTYTTATSTLGSESILISGLPAGGDHSSGRLVYGNDDKLYYSCGDLGNNQFANRCLQIRSQNIPTSAEVTALNYTNYSGKTLRINLDGTIPTDNPTIDPDGPGGAAAVKSHIFTWGHRNPQGLSFEMNKNDGTTHPTLKPAGLFYSSEHGVRTDDEINLLSSGNNYGWPFWSGFRDSPTDNYQYINWSSASGGNCSGTSYNEVTIPGGATVTQENSFPAGTFKEPMTSMFAECNAAPNCATTLTTGTDWMKFPTIAPSSIDHYGFTNIPGWYNSLLIPTLRRGTVYRYKLNATADTITTDSIPYFRRYDRYRDLAYKNGNIIFTITDSIGSTSGPSGSGGNVSRPGTILKYTFLGYVNNGSNKSTLPGTIDVDRGSPNTTCVPGSRVIINSTNNNVWVPITGPDGNIVAEIYANGNNLDTVTASFYTKTGVNRVRSGKRYLNRNITITPKVQPTLPGGSPLVRIRLYISKAEYDSLNNDGSSGISGTGDLRILKNNDACSTAVYSNTASVTPTSVDLHGTEGYVIQGDISSFSSFYIGSANITLPLDLLTFEGSLVNNNTLLKWETNNERNAKEFEVERSTDGRTFIKIGTVAANGNSNSSIFYNYTDYTLSNIDGPKAYYRLKILDNDGKFDYSNIITISLTGIEGKVTVIPNPARNNVQVTIAAPVNGRAQWKLIDNLGRTMLQSTSDLKKGINSLTINLSGLSAGFYYLSVAGAGVDEKVKLQKL